MSGKCFLCDGAQTQTTSPGKLLVLFNSCLSTEGFTVISVKLILTVGIFRLQDHFSLTSFRSAQSFYNFNTSPPNYIPAEFQVRSGEACKRKNKNVSSLTLHYSSFTVIGTSALTEHVTNCS
jgi:hypothetical protein